MKEIIREATSVKNVTVWKTIIISRYPHTNAYKYKLEKREFIKKKKRREKEENMI